MPDTPDQVGSGDLAIEIRAPRFAELDAQTNAHQAREQNPAGKKQKRRLVRPALPREARKEITRCLGEHPKPASHDHLKTGH